ncbi:nucleotidyl transferase AbiEii/AbiGii toxin family protein [Sulfurimonas sp. SAG-AH-194-C20]|nr:nucleotidyl transferase AbiEii/AbiGii toxin family protein [Sulfurimonas sp. SAG-AH-194-C20]MDF1879031.1 nucleotidyl transferase AbiEii/AbiGii toxin family protein [Sulfurimonas sp. SAG-AH-194-C20]
MYDFSVQKEMMIAANYLLKKHGLSDVSALGGGTALAAYYWNHRYSADIDIFTHSEVDITLLFRPAKWDKNFKKIMNELGHTGSKIHPIYTEFVLKDNFKMQFLSTADKTKNPYQLVKLWGMDILLESVEEIIAKKIYYRAHKGNARDLFDIAIAIHKHPSILNELLIPLSKIEELQETVVTIQMDKQLLEEYLYEIDLMNPNPLYNKIALNCIRYLTQFLESYLEAKRLSLNLNDSELLEIENYIYSKNIE